MSQSQQKHKKCGKAHWNVPSGSKWLWNITEGPENATIISKYQESDQTKDICGLPDIAPVSFQRYIEKIDIPSFMSGNGSLRWDLPEQPYTNVYEYK